MVASDEKAEGLLPKGEAQGSEGPLPKWAGGRCCNPIIHKLNSFDKSWKICCAWILFLAFWWFLFRGIFQFIMFHWATMGCSASSLENYRYPGGGWTCPSSATHPDQQSQWANATTPGECVPGGECDQVHCKYSPADNVVPGNALLREDTPSLMGQAFVVYPRGGAATITEAQVGQWWRTYGPWFWTYTYQDVHGVTSLYMRPTLMGMMGLYSESRIMRCDGAGDVWFFGEGSDWISNRIRSFFGAIFGLQREGSFKIYKGSEQYGTAIETFHGDKSISFSRGAGRDAISLGSSVLTSADPNNPSSDLWSLSTQSGTNFRELPPSYVMSAASVLMGFRWITIRHERGIPGGHLTNSPSPPPAFFLAATSNASVAFFEETEEDVHQDPEPLKGGDENANTEASDAAGEKV